MNRPGTLRVGILMMVLVGLANLSHGQNQMITMEKTFGGARFDMDTLTLSLNQVLNVLEDTPFAHDQFKRAKLNYNVMGLFGFTGAVLVALPLVTAAIGGKPEWGLAVAGVALISISIPLNRAFYRHATDALNDYNSRLKTSRLKSTLQLSGAGAKIVIRF